MRTKTRRGPLWGKGPILSDADVVYKEHGKSLAVKKQERILCLCLNAQNQLVKKVTVGIGTESFIETDIRTIVMHPIRTGTKRFILIHNHPSGNTTPSKEDIVLTKNVEKACDLLGLELLDHIIVGDGFRALQGRTSWSDCVMAAESLG